MKNKFSIAMTLAVILAMLVTSLALADGTPTIASDLPDYGPGETVNLFGTGWQPNESVHIFVNDSFGASWSRNVDVVAAGDGAITDTFQLPSWFVATYSVTATGTLSGTATTTFTDAASIISGTVLNDTNGNGIDDGESGLAGATITIYKDKTTGMGIVVGSWDPSDTIQAGPFLTTSSGAWSSGNIPVGNTYFIVETDPTGYTSTNSIPGSDSSNIATTNVNNNQLKVVVASFIGSAVASSTGNKFLDQASDTTAPSISCTVPDQTIWYGNDVTVPCTASDSGSGLANPGDANFSLSTSVSAGTETASALTNSHQVCDNNSNCATAGPYTFKVDKKAPGVFCGSADGVWHASDVSIACTASDGGSGLANSADASFSLSTSVTDGTEDANASTGSHVVADAVGNSSTAGPINGNKIDKKAPTFSCDSAPSAWSAMDVSISCAANDGGSGLATPASFTLSTNVADGTETDNASTGTALVTDNVGHSVTAGPISGIKVDKKAPEFSCDPADSIWHADDQTVNCTASDGGSGLTTPSTLTLSTNVAGDTETDSAYTDSQAVTDGVGHTVTAGPVGPFKIDKKVPQLSSCDAPDGLWHGDDVTLYCHYTDGGSGPATQDLSLSTNVAEGTETSDALASANGVQACDDVGNCAASPADIGANMIDKKAPTITITAPMATTYTLNQVVAVNFTCSDGGSNVATCVGTVANGSNINTASTGSHTFTVNATDNVGNSSTVSVTYNVKFALCVLYDQSKSHKLGSTVPLKLQLCDVNGVNYSSANIVVKATSILKSDNTPSPYIVSDSGNANPDSNFRYDATLGTTGGYIFNLSTKGMSSGTWKVTFTVNGASDPSYVVQFDIK